jgi:hypothetical protein
MTIMLSALAFALSASAASAAQEQLFRKTPSGYTPVPIRVHHKVRLASCPEGSKCQAEKALLSAPPKPTEARTGVDGFIVSPLSIGCQKMKGTPLFLYDRGLNQALFCAFSDGSALSLSDLYGDQAS